jgi:hypothetical protein
MSEPAHLDRRNSGTQPLVFTLTETGLRWRTEDGKWGGDMPFDTIIEVRLSVEMAHKASQVVCRVRDGDGTEAVFGSMRYLGPGRWDDSSQTFSPLLSAFHRALLPFADKIRFVEGRSATFRMTLFGLGLALSATSLAGLVWLVGFQQNAFGLLLIAGIAAGGWLIRLFIPSKPRTYDPQLYAKGAAPGTAPIEDQ